MKIRLPFLILPLAAALTVTACEKRSASRPGASDATTVARVDEAEWCAEHGVPESVCTRCHPNLIAQFKQKGDWCDTHTLPKSQCIECDPSLKEKLEAMAPKK